MSSASSSSPRYRTVAVLGASYGGIRAARILSEKLPCDWRLVVIERNSHFNHVYVFPRYTVISKHASKGFVPYTNLFDTPRTTKESRSTPPGSPPSPPLTPRSSVTSLASSSSSGSSSPDPTRRFIQGSITSLTSRSVSFVRPTSFDPLTRRSSIESLSSIRTSNTYGCFDGMEETIYFDYCIYALGSGMPDPVNVWSEMPSAPRCVPHPTGHGLGTKKGGMRWMESKADQLKRAKSIVIVGGGALGIQYATDLKELYPEKSITLMHSRTRLMPLYPMEMHVAVTERLRALGVEMILGERVVTWPVDPEHFDGNPKVIHTDKGREFKADLVLPCTGQKPHSQILAALSPSSISPTTSRIRVTPTLQISPRPSRPITSRANTLDRLSNMTLKPISPPSPPSSSGSGAPPNGYTGEDDYEEVFEDDDLSHIFAIGDCADTGAIQAGHTAYWMGEVAARNILRLIERDEGRGDEELEVYKHGPPAIKVTLGMNHDITANGEGVMVSQKGVEDLQARLMWPSVGAADMPDDA